MKIPFTNYEIWGKNKKDAQMLQADLSTIGLASGSATKTDFYGNRFLNNSIALKQSAVYACARIISGAIGRMPFRLVTDTPVGTFPDFRPNISKVLNLQPSPLWGATQFWEHVVCSMLLYGDCYIRIFRDNQGRLTKLCPLNFERVKVELVEDTDLTGAVSGLRRNYVINCRTAESPTAKQIRLDQYDVLQFSNFGITFSQNGVCAPSVLDTGAYTAINISSSLDSFLKNHYEHGALSQLILKRSGTWSAEYKEQVKKDFTTRYQLGSNAQFVPIVLDENTEIEQVPTNFDQAALIELKDVQISDIARSFGIPSFLINQDQKQSALGSSIQEVGASFVRYTLAPHIARIEDEINRKLFRNSSSRIEIDSSGLTSSTRAQRFTDYRTALGPNQSGWLTQNEIRRMENLPPLEGEKFDTIPDAPGMLPTTPEVTERAPDDNEAQ